MAVNKKPGNPPIYRKERCSPIKELLPESVGNPSTSVIRR